uniref:Auto-transporter adhesin head GIN domain-containing protein n=1 Tax=Romanomermis culicivorax TaxID=13658 RepID=A0A915L9V1_ROMCU
MNCLKFFLFGLTTAILAVGSINGVEEALTFWDLHVSKSWNSQLLPKDQESEWRLGLGCVPSVINKKPKAILFLSQDETSNVTLAFFSLVEMTGASVLRLGPSASLNLSDHSEFVGRETSATEMQTGSLISAKRSSVQPGVLDMERGSVLHLTDTKLNTFMSKFVTQDSAVLTATSNSHVTLIGGSSFNMGPGSQITMSKSGLEIAGDVIIGERSKLNFNGFELTMVGGRVNVDKNVEINAESKSALTIFGATLNFTEGSKTKLGVQAEFRMERNSSLIMARRDLRLNIEEKGFFVVEKNSHCLMTDDVTILQQSTSRFKSDSAISSIRCFTTYELLSDEKRRRFP